MPLALLKQTWLMLISHKRRFLPGQCEHCVVSSFESKAVREMVGEKWAESAVLGRTLKYLRRNPERSGNRLVSPQGDAPTNKNTSYSDFYARISYT